MNCGKARIIPSKTNERIFCAWCQQWKHGHIVQNIHHEELTEHGTDEWTDVKFPFVFFPAIELFVP